VISNLCVTVIAALSALRCECALRSFEIAKLLLLFGAENVENLGLHERAGTINANMRLYVRAENQDGRIYELVSDGENQPIRVSVIASYDVAKMLCILI
jgi:hypothetical protein